MRRPLGLVILACCAALAGGCGTQQILLGTEDTYVFLAADSVALPGETVQLRAQLQQGDLLQDQVGYVVWFKRDGKIFKAAQTGRDGTARVSFTPAGEGDYAFQAEAAPIGFDQAQPSPQDILVACRRADEPIIVVDLDKTLVASGFSSVLVGQPVPMEHSAKVLARLAQDHSIIYLTHRPEYFGPKSKAWLKDHNYPAGPVLLSSVAGFLGGSEAFKTQMLATLQERFSNIQIGIGDKISDAAAYLNNDIQAFLILHVPPEASAQQLDTLIEELGQLDEQAQVVSGWDEIHQVLFEGKSYPRSAAQQTLSELAEARRPATQPSPASDSDEGDDLPGGAK